MRRIRIVLFAAAVLAAGAGVLLLGREPAAQIPAGTEEERLSYLRSQGWEGTLRTAQPVTVPSDWTGLEGYTALQEAQGLPLREYAGTTGVAYTYSLQGTALRAELLTADGYLAGAQCYDPETGKMLPIRN